MKTSSIKTFIGEVWVTEPVSRSEAFWFWVFGIFLIVGWVVLRLLWVGLLSFCIYSIFKEGFNFLYAFVGVIALIGSVVSSEPFAIKIGNVKTKGNKP